MQNGNIEELEQKVISWATERGIIEESSILAQYAKLQEESGELSKSILESRDADFIDAVGDMLVVLTNLCAMAGTDLATCYRAAWEEIKDRKGELKNGAFVREKP